MSRRLTKVIVPVAVLLVAAAAALAVLQPWSSAADTPDDSEKPVTAEAELTTLTSDLRLNGNLSYGASIALPGRGGTITRLPTAGDVIGVGQVLYEVDGKPVIAMRGDRPFWRDLGLGVENGPDVRQLEQALADLGFGKDMTVDDEFTAVTEANVKAWQKSLGVTKDGVVKLGDVVAITAASVRVESVKAQLGDAAEASPLTYTSTTLRVVVKLTDAQAREILPATRVTVILPDGTEAPATVTAVDPGGQPTETEGETTPATANVEFDDPAVAEGIGLRAVKVVFATSEVKDALVVPVTALVATTDGGYAVDVLRKGGKVERVSVEVGLIADTKVQVVGGELAVGDAVVVAQ
ncbi:peptidoglycan-binding protein [Microbacterium murale]|uniref:Peptidoglycan hydrolase-like protein with peptidoglycan-binding domain n=1 Tax=Microbacterium murale TaxID=1081040 RepID=A0ABU0P635_9MICO|nr:peptidoglycan-binding protein [Microbacterium murale]MDQ0642783.1 peptidoglycan hydrolase-like protein with peptidoglycan-binding domain [Microbacterium murale]